MNTTTTAAAEEGWYDDDVGADDGDNGDEAYDTKGTGQGGVIRRLKTATTTKVTTTKRT